MEAEKWELDFEWLRVRHFIKEKFKKSELPDLNTTLMLIGIQELGHIYLTSKLGVKLNSDESDIVNISSTVGTKGVKDQEILLKELITTYFKNNFPSEFK